MDSYRALQIVDEVFSMYEMYGKTDYIGEPVSQIEHMFQAAELAEAEGYDDEVVLAAFFHDIGHLFDFIMPVSHMEEGVGIADHESIGQEFLLQRGFSSRLAGLVGSHVDAKRYLTFKYPEYFQNLSEASRKTLEHQGGRMDGEEASIFEQDPNFKEYLKLRLWDDMAKIPGKAIPDLRHLRRMAYSHLIKQ